MAFNGLSIAKNCLRPESASLTLFWARERGYIAPHYVDFVQIAQSRNSYEIETFATSHKNYLSTFVESF